MRRLLNNDFAMRISAVGCAIALWMYVVYAENPVVEYWVYSVPVEFVNTQHLNSSHLVFLTDIQSKTIDVKVRGRRRSLGEMAQADINAYVDCALITSGDTFSLAVNADIRVNEVEVVEKKPYSISVTTDKIVEQQKNINLVMSGEPADDYIIEETNVSPAVVMLKGPHSIVNDLTVYTQPFDISNVTNSLTSECGIMLKDSKGGDADAEMLEVGVESVTATCRVSLLKQVTVEPEYKLTNNNLILRSVEAITKSVSIKGDPDIAAGINELKTAVLEIAEPYDRAVLDVKLARLPEGISLYQSDDNVKVLVTAELPAPIDETPPEDEQGIIEE